MWTDMKTWKCECVKTIFIGYSSTVCYQIKYFLNLTESIESYKYVFELSWVYLKRFRIVWSYSDYILQAQNRIKHWANREHLMFEEPLLIHFILT